MIAGQILLCQGKAIPTAPSTSVHRRTTHILVTRTDPSHPTVTRRDGTIATSYTPATMPIMVRAGTTNTEDIR
jgi:hypothetical protein